MGRIGKYAKYAVVGLELLLLYWMWTALFSNQFTDLSQDYAVPIGMGAFLSFETAALAGVIVSKINHTREIGKYAVIGVEAALMHGPWVCFIFSFIRLPSVAALAVGTGSFLSLEMAALTWVIAAKIKNR